eukprot:g5461.t1
MDFKAREATHSGWLAKRAVKSKRNWKTRFFSLHDNILSYYKKDTGTRPRGVLTVTFDSAVRALAVDDEHPHCFEVTTPTAVLVAGAETEKGQEEWIKHVRNVINTCKELREKAAKAMRDRETGGKEEEDNGDGSTHTFVVQGTKFCVDKKYEVIKPIGHGAYGVVVSARNNETKDKVAIKKVPDAFDDLIDGKRILREIKLLRHFNHDNIIGLRDLQKPKSMASFKDVYIVTDLMETDLHRVVYSKQQLSNDHIKYFVYQILRALKYMHSAGVIHRDIKPSNLLLNADCDLKLCDFGLARGIDRDELTLTEYVVTRWYRAPEIMLACPNYTKAIDVWAVGCIMAELFGRKPLFPGNDYIHQLKIISDVVGTPAAEDLDWIASDRARNFMTELPRKPRIPFGEIYPNASEAGIDLLDKMLQFNPAKRITVEAALTHPYMSNLASPDEPVCPRLFNFEEEGDELDEAALRRLIYAEVCAFHPLGSEGKNGGGKLADAKVSSEGKSSTNGDDSMDLSK